MKPLQGLLQLSLILAAHAFSALGADPASSADAPEFFEVFSSRTDGFASVRIPSVVALRSGTLVALVEGRQADADQAKNRLIAKRSTDGGKHWSPLIEVAGDGQHSLNNPCAVVEEASQKIVLIYQSYPIGLAERSSKIATGYEGDSIVRNFLVTSEDEGRHWSSPLDVTRSTKRPEKVTIMASGPGVGIQLTRGPHRGRLLIPFNEGPFDHWNVDAAFSDDGGVHWQLGEPAPNAHLPMSNGGTKSQVNEVQMVELSDGSVRLNSRRWAGTALRKTAVSQDGGKSWSPISDVPDLIDGGCMTSILRYSFPSDSDRSRILYSGPNSLKREKGTVRISYDEGATWPVKREFWPGAFAYSVLVALPNRTVGCLFETGQADRLLFARIPLQWIETSVK